MQERCVLRSATSTFPGWIPKKTKLLEQDSSKPEGQVEVVNVPRADSIHENRHREMKATNLDVPPIKWWEAEAPAQFLHPLQTEPQVENSRKLNLVTSIHSASSAYVHFQLID